MENRKIRVAITHGDTNGIGYELIFKTFAAPEMLELCTPIIYGSPKVATYHQKALDIPATFSIISKAEEARDGRVNLLTTFDEEVKVELGQQSKEAGHAALMALDRAVTDYKDHLFDVLVMGPVNVDSIQNEGFEFKGQFNYVEECFTDNETSMTLLVNEGLRVGLLTNRVALKEVAADVTAENLTAKIELFMKCLQRDFLLSNPRLAVLALNPTEGKEEQEVIAPVIKAMAQKHVNVFGPYAADDFFAHQVYDHFDGVLAMYHDQGIAPFMALTPANGVVMAAGMPIICTATNLNAGYSIAGKGLADEQPLRNAIYLALDIYRNRQTYDEAGANPLPKLYREKRDESEKVRFSIPKKHENSIKEQEKK